MNVMVAYNHALRYLNYTYWRIPENNDARAKHESEKALSLRESETALTKVSLLPSNGGLSSLPGRLNGLLHQRRSFGTLLSSFSELQRESELGLSGRGKRQI